MNFHEFADSAKASWETEIPASSKHIEPIELGAPCWVHGTVEHRVSYKLPEPKTNRQRRERAKIKRRMGLVWASLGNWKRV